MIRVRPAHVAAIIVTLSLAGYPLGAGVSALLSIPSTPISITMRGSLLALSLVLIAYNLTRQRHLGPLTLLLLVVLGLYGARLVVETAFNAGALSQAPSYYWAWYLGVVSLPVVAVVLAGRLDFVLLQRLAFVVFSVAAVAAALSGSVEKESGGQLVSTGRAALETLNPISLGNVGASLALLSIWGLFGQESVPFLRKIILTAALLMGLYLVFISASRGPLVSTAVAALFMGFSLRGRSRIWFLLGGSALVVPVFVYLISIESTLNVNFIGRLNSFQSDGDMSNTIRIDLYTTSFHRILEYPLLGSGIEIEEYASYPHNFYLEYFMATGIFGGLLSLIVLPLLVIRAAILVRQRAVGGGFALLYIQSFLGAMFSAAVYSNSALWMTAAVMAVTTANRVAKPKNSNKFTAPDDLTKNSISLR